MRKCNAKLGVIEDLKAGQWSDPLPLHIYRAGYALDNFRFFFELLSKRIVFFQKKSILSLVKTFIKNTFVERNVCCDTTSKISRQTDQ